MIRTLASTVLAVALVASGATAAAASEAEPVDASLTVCGFPEGSVTAADLEEMGMPPETVVTYRTQAECDAVTAAALEEAAGDPSADSDLDLSDDPQPVDAEPAAEPEPVVAEVAEEPAPVVAPRFGRPLLDM